MAVVAVVVERDDEGVGGSQRGGRRGRKRRGAVDANVNGANVNDGYIDVRRRLYGEDGDAWVALNDKAGWVFWSIGPFIGPFVGPMVHSAAKLELCVIHGD